MYDMIQIIDEMHYCLSLNLDVRNYLRNKRKLLKITEEMDIYLSMQFFSFPDCLPCTST